MKRNNRNSKSILWYIFTLLSFGLGVIAYILIKHKDSAKKKISSVKVKKVVPVLKKEKVVNNVMAKSSIKLSKRQKMIVKVLIEKGKVYPNDLKELLPDVSVRTIRRDMDKLESLKLAEQKGSTKSTYYRYTGN